MQHLLVQIAPLTNFDAGVFNLLRFIDVFLGWFPQLFNAFWGGKWKKIQENRWKSDKLFPIFFGVSFLVDEFSVIFPHLTGHLWCVWKISRCEGNEIVKEMQRGKASFPTINLPWFQGGKIFDFLKGRKEGIQFCTEFVLFWRERCSGFGNAEEWDIHRCGNPQVKSSQNRVAKKWISH